MLLMNYSHYIPSIGSNSLLISRFLCLCCGMISLKHFNWGDGLLRLQAYTEIKKKNPCEISRMYFQVRMDRAGPRK